MLQDSVSWLTNFDESMPEMKPNKGELEHLLKSVDQDVASTRHKADPSESSVRITLEDFELWSKFKELTNEMIVTKSGR